jgi:hypothetical protein
VVKMNLDEPLYPAILAEASCTVGMSLDAMEVCSLGFLPGHVEYCFQNAIFAFVQFRVSGFSDKIDEILKVICSCVVMAHDLEARVFEIAKERVSLCTVSHVRCF